MSRPVRDGDLIAVYGLLRAGQSGFACFGLAGAFEARGPCLIPGLLYDLGDYPGLVGGPGHVRGELFAVRNALVMPRLDAFEDYWPGDRVRTRYERRRLTLADPDGVEAWVYVWARPLTGARPIPGGDWLNR
ncbi:MAG: gamma-glutamylcyclotransferase family protein [Oceanicaulis sp.]